MVAIPFRLSIDPYLQIEQKRNGEILSRLVRDFCLIEKPTRVLFCRSLVTGAFLDHIDLPEGIAAVRLQYAQTHQPSSVDCLSRDHFDSEMQAMARRGDRFDLIVVDPWHEYASSLADLELCLPLLAPRGLLLSHDCAPPRAEMATPTPSNNWCGLTYAALATFAQSHPDLAVQVLDTDTGIGVVWRRDSLRANGWLQLRPWRQRKQSARLQSLIDSKRHDEAFHFFRRHGAVLVGLRKSRRRQIIHLLSAVRRRLHRVLGLVLAP